jgi:hypothetical protein
MSAQLLSAWYIPNVPTIRFKDPPCGRAFTTVDNISAVAFSACNALHRMLNAVITVSERITIVAPTNESVVVGSALSITCSSEALCSIA